MANRLFLVYGPDDAARVADGYGMRRDVLRYDASCPDDRTFADGDSRQDDTAAAQPAFILDHDRFGGDAVRQVISVFALRDIQDPL